MALLRHGGMSRAFDFRYAPSTPGRLLRSFAFGHVRQLDAIASRFLGALVGRTPVLADVDQAEVVNLSDTIMEVHGYVRQGAAFGYLGCGADDDAPFAAKGCSCCSVRVEPGVFAGGEVGVVDGAAIESGDGVDVPVEVLGDGPYGNSGCLPALAERVDGDDGL
jgi:hypothetical protein